MGSDGGFGFRVYRAWGLLSPKHSLGAEIKEVYGGSARGRQNSKVQGAQ